MSDAPISYGLFVDRRNAIGTAMRYSVFRLRMDRQKVNVAVGPANIKLVVKNKRK